MTGVPDGEEEEQEIENLFEKIVKENFPNLAKEVGFQGRPGSWENPKETGSKKKHTKTYHNYITQD